MNAPTISQPEQHVADEIVDAWCADGVFRSTWTEAEEALGPRLGLQLRRAFASSHRFFSQSAGRKSRFVSDLTYAGYAAPGEEGTNAAEPDVDADVNANSAVDPNANPNADPNANAKSAAAIGASGREAFTVCQDIAPDDPRVRERWPCHGPVPWPDAEFRRAMLALTDELSAFADRLLLQVALGLGLDDPNLFARLTWSGWHHLRTEHVPPQTTASVVIPNASDDGLLVIATQDDSDVLTITPGTVLQFIAGGILSPTPAASAPQPDDARERYTLTYHHAPNFQSCVRPAASASGNGCLHYGTHITNAFMRRYPERVTTLRILAEERLAVLAGLREQAARAAIGSRTGSDSVNL